MILITPGEGHLEAVVHDYQGIDLVKLAGFVTYLPIVIGTGTIMLLWMPRAEH